MDISIIIPNYNSYYIEDCLESAISQINVTYEILCIDDGSEDNSASIIYDYSEKYSNVRVIKISHRGVAYSRNLGIAEAKGKYVCFLDADDVYPDSYVLHSLFEVAREENANVVGGSFSEFNKNIRNSRYSGELDGYEFHSSGWINYEDYQFDYGFHRFLYKKEFLTTNKIVFPELLRFQDPPFLVNALATAGKFYAIDRIVYAYRLNENGVQWNEQKIADCLQGIKTNLQFAVQNNMCRLQYYSISRLIRLLGDQLMVEDNCNTPKILAEMNQIQCLINLDFDYGLLKNDYNILKKIQHKYWMYKTNITAVVPAYNVEKYIKHCLDSLIYQSEGGLKIVVINDGSTDDTLSICEQYANRYSSQITLISKENKGLGAARNTGLGYVTTEYVFFLDSDDWQDIHFVKKINTLLKYLDYKPDIIFTLPHCYDEASHLCYDWMDKSIHHAIFDIKRTQGNEPINGELCPDLYLLEVNANRKIYKANFLNDLKFTFPEGVKWEDIRPHIQLLHEAKHCVGISETGFNYRTNSGGQITSEAGEGRLDIIPVFEDTIKYVNEHTYSRDEIARIVYLICKYTIWMIEMTNNKYIIQLLESLHIIFSEISDDYISFFSQSSFLDESEKRKYLGIIQCLQNDKYMKLAHYDERENLYRYWSEYGPSKKQNIIMGGIQCVKESGIRYTVRLAIRKLQGKA